MSAPLALLLVEDYALDALLLQELFDLLPDGERPALVHVNTISAAESELATRPFDCVLLDLGLPDGDGVENIQRIRAASRHVTIVVMTGLDDEQRAVESLQLGAQEYLVKGRHDPAGLLRHLRHAIQRNNLLTAVDRERAQQQRLAAHDALTGLPNRQQLTEHALLALANAQRRGERLALSFIDLDGFKAVNDRLGHAIGDAALIAVARALQGAGRKGDVVARLGGDEFVVLQVSVREPAEALEAAARLAAAVCGIERAGDQPVSLGASVGTAIYPDHGVTLDELLAHADAQMYDVKRGGGARPAPLHPDWQVGSDETALVFQPWTGSDGRAAGMEALLRHRRDGRWTSPERLLGASRNADLPHWVLHTACQAWSALHHAAPARLAVNMSARDLLVPDFADEVSAALDKYGLLRGTLQIELAEPFFATPDATLRQRLDGLRAAGVRIVLDRFGSGPGSLRLLAELPLDGVKVDRSVVRGLATDAADASRAVLAGIVAAATVRGLEVIAVGVENGREAQACRELSCERLQGLWFAPPVQAEQLPSLLARVIR